jgi:hypothetical protein
VRGDLGRLAPDCDARGADRRACRYSSADVSVRTFGAFSVAGLAQLARSARSQPWVFDGEELPPIRDALERMDASILEHDS